MTKFLLILFIHIFIFTNVSASTGDRSQFYRQCLLVCYSSSCKHNVEFEIVSFDDGGFLSWSCEENCRYDCMWETVNHFIDHGLKVPQFHGKWPFIRMFGFQEPASVIFSILNFYAHIMMYRKFRREIKSSMPMSLIWTYFTVVCLNAWFWSAIFHARDKPFTEVMDYSCAFTMVITLLYCMLIRIFYKNNKLFAVITFGYISMLSVHLSHLWSGKINYGYNMKINIVFGFLTFLITVIWWYRNSSKLTHSYLIGWFTILTVAVTLLEVADFPPIFWTLDAHALWHASTAPLVYLLYKFMISDCHYLRKQYSYQVISDIHVE
ncbi:post-GPI attachment to proteins factor 3 isoform X1 [Microplitis demolitor]|uniref:post-GPI attachment to proteins factor 3 isoform X1 n=1 Tax=Microplitis demolitor TaxID=69319 RepID=UPI0004CCBC5E|nr:post-GPI attachment to proteins factor 3 isoform X1 [Microplitis demolitor]